MIWKTLIGGTALIGAAAMLTLPSARGTDGAQAAFEPVIDAVACRPGDRANGALKTYLAAARARTEIGPFDRHVVAPAGDATGDAPLIDGLGTRRYRITTTRPLVRRYFDQGLALAYGFNHAAARDSFRTAQRLDPECAMCFWGEALVLGPNINLPMSAADNAPALAAIGRARALAGRAGAKERMLIEALAARYSDDPAAKRAQLDAAYADAMQRVHARFWWDHDVAVLYVEALMNLSPWDYWEAAGTRPKGRTADIVATLERVLAVDFEHPGAVHFYIHAVEASANPARAVRYAERLGNAVPGAGHLVHMPSHIYFRVGRYLDSLAANKRAVAADERFFALAGGDGVYRYGYYPHSIHFLLASAQMAGDAPAAIDAAAKLAGTLSADVTRAVPWVQPIMAAPYFAHAQFGEPAAVLALPAPGADFPYVRAMWHYARGIAHAGRGDVAATEGEIRAIARLERASGIEALAAGGVPAADVLRIARHVLAARVAQARGALPAAIAELERAVVIEDSLPYMEPPFWYYPVRQSLGGVLALAGELDRAEVAFRASLARAPNNAWALSGLAQVYERRGDLRAAAAAKRRFDAAWAGSWNAPDLARL